MKGRPVRTPSRTWVTSMRFALVGLGNTALGLAVILAARYGLGWSDMAANALGYGCGLAAGFTVNRRWTFASRLAWSHSVPRYAAVVAVAWSVNIASVLMLTHSGLPSGWAHAAAVLPYTVITYLGCRAWVFRETPA